MGPIEPSPVAELPSVSLEPDVPVSSPNAKPGIDSLNPSGPLTLSITNFPEMPSPSPEFFNSLSAQPINEGCVAVEHLEGYALQHSRHFKRRVLCAEGFCATPNHAIIVDDEITSMKQLCRGKWSCVETEKLVNNLNVFVNSHAKINDRITVTAYDIRFPRWCVVIAQAMEITWNVVVSNVSILLTLTFTFIAIVIQTRQRSKIE